MLSGVRVLEEIQALGYRGGKTILDDRLRELRPRYLPPPRSFQRTVYRPGELAQFDLTEPLREIPVGFGQTGRAMWSPASCPIRAVLRRARLLEGVLRHRLGHELLSSSVRGAAEEARLGP
jgi:hypothetical protein